MEKREFLFLDGAMGTMLQQEGLPLGELPESWNITHPEKVTAVHRRYIEAGSRVIYANTFGANGLKTAGSGYSTAALIEAGIACARAAAGALPVRVALDVGPLGQLLEPLGTLRFERAYALFREIMTAGEKAGADLVVIETMGDLYEVKAAVLAAKENTKLPVWVTMTFEERGRSFVGTTVSAMALTLTGLGVDALGFNCSLGPTELLPLVKELRQWTELPIILKPNAGLPDPATGRYALTASAFAEALLPARELGVDIFGGCCGTTPDFIRALRERLAVPEKPPERPPLRCGVCSGLRTVSLEGVHVIGERINPTGKKRFQQALREGDLAYIVERGIEQQDAGAEILDVNVGLPGLDEAALLPQVVRALQEVTELPLMLDSSDPRALEAGLRAVNGKTIVNSVNGDEKVLDTILPLCKKYGAAVVGLCMDKNGIPRSSQERVRIAEHILDAALAHGIPKSDLLIDCLTLTVSAQQEQARETLRAVRTVTEELGLSTVLGVSNISFGLPAREQVTVSFLTQAMGAGLGFPIVNPNQSAVMDAVAAFRVLSGEDRAAENYIARFADRKPEEARKPGEQMGLAEAVMLGLKTEAASLTRAALQSMAELEVVDRLLIPALDRVGERYERQELFLPQLINAANAACEGFEIIKTRLASRGGTVSKGKIVLATVQGDIHDIGKNIVRVVLENYGYTVIDLGRDVPPAEVVEAVRRERARLVGLSALMTTTVPSMAETIRALRESGLACKIMVGGAVLTPEYAARIGADYYARDAKQSADIAREVLG